MPFITANEINIYYEILGNKADDNATTLLLLGGLSRDHRIWHKVIPELDKSLKIILMDNRGVGQTDKPDKPYTIDLMSNDVIAVIENLRLRNVILVGHSMGSFVAGYVAAKRPDLLQHAVLISCAIKQVDRAKDYLSKRIAFITKKLMAAADATKISTANSDDIKQAMPSLYSPSFLTTDNINEIVAWETANPYPQPGYAFIRQAQACIDYDGTSVLPLIKIPITIIYGENDLMYNAMVSEEIAKVIPHAKLIKIKNAAHMIQIEQSQELVKYIHAIAGII